MNPSLTQFFELSIDMLCVADTDGYYRLVNAAFTETLGWSREELLADPFITWVHPDDIAATRHEMARLSRGEATVHFDNRYRTRDGRWVWLEWTCCPDPASNLLYAIARDVTATKELEAGLVRARDEAERANLAKSQFLTAMSHELRTPLNAIIGYSELLGEEADAQGLGAMATDLGRIREAGRQLLELINQVLDLARVEAGRMDVQIGPVDLDVLVAATARTVEPLAAQRRNRLQVDTACPLGEVATDAVKLRQILLNLLSNACKFTDAGEVRLSVTREAGVTRFVVSDTGVGIAPTEVESIFEPFARGSAGHASGVVGTGLGLSISRRFATLLGGSLEVDSALGRGTTFTLTLPDAPAPGHAPPIRVRRTRAAGVTPSDEHATVLVVDDDEDARVLLSRALERGGYHVVTASGAVEGLEMAKRVRPLAILLDLLMPGQDGWAALAELQRDPGLAQTPVIIVSTVDASDVGFARGADGYVTKPVERERLLTALARLLGGRGREQ